MRSTLRGGTDWAAEPALYRASRRPAYVGEDRRSFHVTMRDGARLAIDVHLPRGAETERLPTILRQTRYYRGFDVPKALAKLVPETTFDPVNARTRAFFLANGYAWVDVDARGSGASFGTRPCPWWTDEVEDGAEIVSWIVKQPWSSGVVGSTGVSYDGTAAEMLLVNRHPAVKAIAPRFSLFDVFTDVAFPGGIHLAWFTEAWGRANAALDRNRPDGFVGEILKLATRGAESPSVDHPGTWERRFADLVAQEHVQGLVSLVLRGALGGVRPIDDDRDRALLREAIASHGRNFNVHEGALSITYRDDPASSPTHRVDSIDAFSPSRYVDAIRGSGAAIYSYSGWFDGAYQHAAIKRHRALGGGDHRLILGPWNHGGMLDMSPFASTSASHFDHDAELLRFFDRHLRGASTGIERDKPVRYFTMGRERWSEADAWPPPSRPTTFFLAEGRRLVSETPRASAEDPYRVDATAGTGHRARWRCLLSPYVHVDYPRRAEADEKLLVYESPVLDVAIEVTGHPLVTLFAAFDAPDATVFAYLEDVAPSGRTTLVTEGCLRALHRKIAEPASDASPTPNRTFLRADAAPLVPGEVVELAFDLLPTSYLFAAGNRVRLALAGADADHFAAIPNAATTWRLQRGPAHPSRLVLPVIG